MIELACCVIGGIAFGRHFGVFDGFAAACVIYALMPWQYGRRG